MAEVADGNAADDVDRRYDEAGDGVAAHEFGRRPSNREHDPFRSRGQCAVLS
jgi:hypothetical protein